MSPTTSTLPVLPTDHGHPHDHDAPSPSAPPTATPPAASAASPPQCSGPGPSAGPHAHDVRADAEVEVALALHNMHRPASLSPRRASKRRRVDDEPPEADHRGADCQLPLPRFSLSPGSLWDSVPCPQSADDPVVHRIAACIVDGMRANATRRSQDHDSPRPTECTTEPTTPYTMTPVADDVIQAVDAFFKCEQEMRAAEKDLNAAIAQIASLLSTDSNVAPVASLQPELYRFYSAAEATRQAKRQLSHTYIGFTKSRGSNPTSPVDPSSPAAEEAPRAPSSERAPGPCHRLQPLLQRVQYPPTPPVLSPPLAAKSDQSPSPSAEMPSTSQQEVPEVEIKLEWQAPPLREQDKCPRPILLPPELFRLTRRSTIAEQSVPAPPPDVLSSFALLSQVRQPNPSTLTRRQELALKEQSVATFKHPPIPTMPRHTPSRSYWQPYVAVYHTQTRDDRRDAIKPQHPPK